MNDPDETQRLRMKDTVAQYKSDLADRKSDYQDKQRQITETEDRLSLVEAVLESPEVYALIPADVRHQDEEGIKVAAKALTQIAAWEKKDAPFFNAMVAVSGATATGVAYSASMIAGSSSDPAIRDFYRVYELQYEQTINSDKLVLESEGLLKRCGLDSAKRPSCESPLQLFRDAWALFSAGTATVPAVLMPLRSCIAEVVDALLVRAKSPRRKFTGEGCEQREKVKEILKYLARHVDDQMAFHIAETLASATVKLSENKQSTLDRHQLRTQLVASSHALNALLVTVVNGPS